MTHVRPHDPFSPHVPLPQFQAPQPQLTEAQRRETALKELAIAEHASGNVRQRPATSGRTRKRKTATRKRRPTKAEVDAAVQALEPPK